MQTSLRTRLLLAADSSDEERQTFNFENDVRCAVILLSWQSLLKAIGKGSETVLIDLAHIDAVVPGALSLSMFFIIGRILNTLVISQTTQVASCCRGKG